MTWNGMGLFFAKRQGVNGNSGLIVQNYYMMRWMFFVHDPTVFCPWMVFAEDVPRENHRKQRNG